MTSTFSRDMENSTFMQLGSSSLSRTRQHVCYLGLVTKHQTTIATGIKLPPFTSIYTISLAFVALLFHYYIKHAYFSYRIRQARVQKIPPMLPHHIPIVGNTLSYWWNPSKFTNNIVPLAAEGSPVRVKILGKAICVVTGRDNVAAIWRYSSLSISTILFRFALGQVFGMPKKAADRVVQDDSGFLAAPHPESNVAPHNRVDRYVHESLKTFLSGPGLEPFVRRFESNLMSDIQSVEVDSDWIELPDFFDFLTSLITPAVIRALCGPFLLKFNPGFCQNFWKYINGLAPIAKGVPRFLNPTPYTIRDALVRDLQSWHTYARENFDSSKVDVVKDIDPFWGCKLMRERQEIFHRMDDFDDYAVAAGDLGAIIGVTSNPIVGSFWACYETFRDAQVLARARFEAVSSRHADNAEFGSDSYQQPTHGIFDISKLVRQPMLQSIFAETLRLRMTFFITRYTLREEIRLGNWRLPKKEVIFVPTSVAHLDTTAWNEGRNREHPLEEFWAHRFLRYADDPWSGPRKKETTSFQDQDKSPLPRENQDSQPKFSLQGLYSSWIPFGGGIHICPGRHFSKRQMVVVISLMVSMFDVEFLSHDAVEVNSEDFGIGVQKPARRVPFRIRRRP